MIQTMTLGVAEEKVPDGPLDWRWDTMSELDRRLREHQRIRASANVVPSKSRDSRSQWDQTTQF
jgi:hypothetical protein